MANSSFTLNSENFMTAAGASISYTVDTAGPRTKKTVSGTTTNYFYSGSQVISELQGSTWTDYVFFGSQRIAKQTGSTSTYGNPVVGQPFNGDVFANVMTGASYLKRLGRHPENYTAPKWREDRRRELGKYAPYLSSFFDCLGKNSFAPSLPGS